MTLPPPDALPDDETTFVQQLRASRTLQAPPAAVLQRAMDIWRPRGAAGVAQAAGALLRRLQAVLQHDSGWAPPTALGLRSAGGDIRQLLFSVDQYDVDLRVRAQVGALPPAWQLRGQLLGPTTAGRVELRCGEWSAHADWNALCEFRFDGVPAGDCSLVLVSGDWEIALGPVRLPPPA